MSHLFYLSQTLTTLDLQYNRIEDTVIQAIGKALRRNQAL